MKKLEGTCKLIRYHLFIAIFGLLLSVTTCFADECGDLFNLAKDYVKKGTEHSTAGRYTQAAEHYGKAADLWQRATDACTGVNAEKAEEAMAATLILYAMVKGDIPREKARLVAEEAERQEKLGSEASSRQDWNACAEHYKKAAELYARAYEIDEDSYDYYESCKSECDYYFRGCRLNADNNARKEFLASGKGPMETNDPMLRRAALIKRARDRAEEGEQKSEKGEYRAAADLFTEGAVDSIRAMSLTSTDTPDFRESWGLLNYSMKYAHKCRKINGLPETESIQAMLQIAREHVEAGEASLQSDMKPLAVKHFAEGAVVAVQGMNMAGIETEYMDAYQLFKSSFQKMRKAL